MDGTCDGGVASSSERLVLAFCLPRFVSGIPNSRVYLPPPSHRCSALHLQAQWEQNEGDAGRFGACKLLIRTCRLP